MSSMWMKKNSLIICLLLSVSIASLCVIGSGIPCTCTKIVDNVEPNGGLKNNVFNALNIGGTVAANTIINNGDGSLDRDIFTPVYAKQNAGGRYTTLVTINSFLGVFQVYLSTDRPVQNDVINLGDWVPGEPLELNGVKYDYVPNGHENLWP